eukprot:4213725-Ditylum_brightwellii.AAC.1
MARGSLVGPPICCVSDPVVAAVNESGSLICESLGEGSYSVRKVTSNRINEGVFAKQADGATRQ